MVVYYRNRFIKVFSLSLALSAIVVIYLIGVIRAIDSMNSDSILFNPILVRLVMLVAIVDLGMYFWSHYLLAKAKGYSGWLTLLAFFNVIGLAIIFLLPDKQKAQD